MSEWRPIDSAPKDGTCVLVGSQADPDNGWDGIVDVCYWDHNFCDREAWVLFSEGPDFARPPHLYTHWMPLPEPPK